MGSRLRIAVVGHVEHITLGRVPHPPGEGEIAHLAEIRSFPGGGGGITFHQLVKSDAEVLLFSAVGNDDAGRFVESALRATPAQIHLAKRDTLQTRDIVMISDAGERTIVVVGQPLHPRIEDPLPWELLASCDAVYFTAQDPAVLTACRAARVLVVTARRREAIAKSGVEIDVIVGSALDPREASKRTDYTIPPRALVMTEGGRGGYVETATGIARFSPVPVKGHGGAYGAGDSFAGALTYGVASGLEPLVAAQAAAPYGAAVLSQLSPLDAQLRLGSERGATR